MIKLVASDLDGTLLMKGAQGLPEDIFPLIRQLKELGILFVAAAQFERILSRCLPEE